MTQQPGGWSGSDPMPSLQEYMQQQRQQKFWDMLSQMGQGIMAANRKGQSPLRAVSAGLAQGRPASGHGTGGLLDWMKMRGYEQKQQDWQEKRNREKRQDYARSALSTGRMPAGLDPRTGIDWTTPRQPPRGLIMADEPAAFGQPGQQQPPLTPEQLARLQPPAGLLGHQGFGVPTERQGLLSEAYPKAYGKAMTAQAFPKEPKYGTPVTVQGPNGPELVRFPQGAGDPVSVQGYSPYTKPDRITLSQQSSNAEIDQARATLDRKGLSKEEVYRQTQKALNTGRTNKEYDEALDRIVRTATQRKTGPDLDYQRYYGLYLGGVELSDPAGMRPLPPGMSAEEPSFMDRGLSFLGFGGDTNSPGAAAAKPIEAMTAKEISGIINTKKAQSLTQDELDRLYARLAVLGFK